MKFKPIHVFLTLCILFLAYSVFIYLMPLKAGETVEFDVKKASEGRLVFQKYNCQSCHQLYGLGGHLGPDLTNTYSQQYKGEHIIRAMVRTGIKQMPKFDLTIEEEDALIEFLKSTDASGSADPRTFKVLYNGMTQQTK